MSDRGNVRRGRGRGNRGRGRGRGQSGSGSSNSPAPPAASIPTATSSFTDNATIPAGLSNSSTGNKQKKSNWKKDKKEEHPVALPESEVLDERNMFDEKRATIQHIADNTPPEDSLQVHCIKKEFERGTKEASMFVLTNRFEVTLPTKELYEYRLQGLITDQEKEEDKKPSRDRRKTFIEKAIETCTLLRDQQDLFVADDFGLIVAWSDLSTYGGATPAVPRDILKQFSICLREPKADSKGNYRPLELVYSGKVAIESFLDVCKGDIKRFPITNVNENGSKTLTVEHAMNLILAEATKASRTSAFHMGSKKMFLTEPASDESMDIVTGVNLHQGYYSTVKYGMGKPLLNVSRTATVFWREMPLEEYLKKRGCESSIEKHIQNALKGVKVKVQYLDDHSKTIKSFGVKKPIEQLFRKAIDWDTDPETEKKVAKTWKDITVYDNLASKKEARLTSQRLKAIAQSPFHCANIGGNQRGKEEWYPVEELIIVGEQLYRGRLTADAKGKMISEARCDPGNVRTSLCSTALELLGVFEQTKHTSVRNKASLSVTQKMLEIPARRVSQPKVEVRRSAKEVKDSESQIKEAKLNDVNKWNWVGHRFFSTENKLSGPVVFLIERNLRAFSEKEFVKVEEGKKLLFQTADVGEEYAKALVDSLETLGVEFDSTSGQKKYAVIDINLQKDASNDVAFDKALEEAKRFQAGLVVFVNDKKSNSKHFDEFRRAADQRHGVQALCMTDDATRFALRNMLSKNSTTLTAHMANIAMKVNTKLGNINHAVRRSLESIDGLHDKLYTDDGLLDTIILAADVVHVDKATEDGTPSLAAVVGSIDGDFVNYLGSMRPNDINFEPIKDISDMVVERLRAWSENNMINDKHRLPKRIIYYRDGVGDGQYYEIRKSELISIRTAYHKLHTEYTQTNVLAPSTPPSSPSITAIIVTKRHHTRFFPKSTSPKQNCAPGTVVDSGVTSPYHFDFFLQSHHALVGTARPTYYVVLENEIDLTPRQLQDFTNLLCYTYVRATLPVGYVPPTYYADRLCDRARCYIRDAHAALKKENKDKAKAAKKEKKKFAKGLRVLGGTGPGGEADAATEVIDTTQGTGGSLFDDSEDEVEVEFVKSERRGHWFDRYRANDGNTHGPWHSNLNDTMFWM